MNKKSDDEFGILLTREMQNMMLNDKLSAQDRIDMFRAIVTGEELNNPILQSFAESIKSGYDFANNQRKESIYKRRNRQVKYARDRRASTKIDVDERASLLKVMVKGKGKVIESPFSPNGEKGEPSQISPDDILGPAEASGETVDEIADSIREWYPYQVTDKGLKKSIREAVKKNSARALIDGIAAWRASGAWDEARFVPRRIVTWIREGQYMTAPPSKKTSAARETHATAEVDAALIEDDRDDGMSD